MLSKVIEALSFKVTWQIALSLQMKPYRLARLGLQGVSEGMSEGRGDRGHTGIPDSVLFLCCTE